MYSEILKFITVKFLKINYINEAPDICPALLLFLNIIVLRYFNLYLLIAKLYTEENKKHAEFESIVTYLV